MCLGQVDGVETNAGARPELRQCGQVERDHRADLGIAANRLAIVHQHDGLAVGRHLDGTEADSLRQHADHARGNRFTFEPTVFGYAFEIPPPPVPDRDQIHPYTCSTGEDMRWDRCNIKSTSLLGNVLHYNQGHSRGDGEILLFNANDELTECGACNAYIVKDGVVVTPPLDNQILPGITRQVLLSILAADGSIPLEERVVTRDEVLAADEIWISSSSKEVVPVVQLDGKPVGDGKPGPVWEKAAKLYSAGKFDY